MNGTGLRLHIKCVYKHIMLDSHCCVILGGCQVPGHYTEVMYFLLYVSSVERNEWQLRLHIKCVYKHIMLDPHCFVILEIDVR